MHSPDGDREGHRGEEIDDPARVVGRGPLASTGDEALVRAVRDEDDRENEGDHRDEPRCPRPQRGLIRALSPPACGLGRRGGARTLEREEDVHVAGREAVPEAPDANRGDEDDELDRRGEEMRPDGSDRLLAEDERGEWPLEDEEPGKADPRDEAPLASASHEQGDDGVHEREEVAQDREVRRGAGEPRRSSRVGAVEHTREQEQDRREEHEYDDRTKRPCHRYPLRRRHGSPSFRARRASKSSIVSGGTKTAPRSAPCSLRPWKSLPPVGTRSCARASARQCAVHDGECSA